jgi:hypothetical protein
VQRFSQCEIAFLAEHFIAEFNRRFTVPAAQRGTSFLWQSGGNKAKATASGCVGPQHRPATASSFERKLIHHCRPVRIAGFLLAI